MNTQHIHIGVEDSKRGFERFVAAWHDAQSDATQETEVHLNFKNSAMLASVLTPKRLELLIGITETK